MFCAAIVANITPGISNGKTRIGMNELKEVFVIIAVLRNKIALVSTISRNPVR
jgi:hypothetical protein